METESRNPTPPKMEDPQEIYSNEPQDTTGSLYLPNYDSSLILGTLAHKCEITRKRLVHDIKESVRQNRDMIMCIEGYEGDGKSKLGQVLGKEIDSDFFWQKNVIFAPTEETLEKKIFEIKKYGFVLADEAMDSLYKREAASRTNIDLNKFFARIRKFNRVVGLCLPSFNDLDPFFRMRRVRVRITIICRGLAIVRIARKLAVKDPWFTDYNEKVMENALNESDIINMSAYDILSIYEQFRGYLGPITWRDDEVPNEDWIEYEKMAMDSTIAKSAQPKVEELGALEKRYRAGFLHAARLYMNSTNQSLEDFHRALTIQTKGVEIMSMDSLKKSITALDTVQPMRRTSRKHDLSALDAEIQKIQLEDKKEEIKQRFSDAQ